MKKRVPIWLVAGAAILIVAVVGYMVGVKPKRAELQKLDDEIAALQTQISAATRLSAAPADAGDAPAIRVADLVALAKAMPDELDMPGIILELSSAASAAGVEFTAIQPGTATAGAGYLVAPVTLTFQGSYYELTELLYRLRTLVTVRDGTLDANGRLLTLDAINLAEGKGGFPQVQAVLTVSAYQYGIDPSLLAPVEGGAPAPPATEQTTTGGETTTVPAAPTDTSAPPPPPTGQQAAEEATP